MPTTALAAAAPPSVRPASPVRPTSGRGRRRREIRVQTCLRLRRGRRVTDTVQNAEHVFARVRGELPRRREAEEARVAFVCGGSLVVGVEAGEDPECFLGGLDCRVVRAYVPVVRRVV